MASKSPKITPPFHWLGPFSDLVALSLTTLLGAFFRLWHLETLPPGLGSSVATSALATLRLIEHGTWPGFEPAVRYAPGWAVLQALPVHLFGPTALSLRYLPALLGTAAIVTTWLWLRSWFGHRIALIGAILMAVTPWVVTLSRTGAETAIMPLLLTTALWLVTGAWRQRSLRYIIATALWLATCLFFGPLAWTIVGAVLVLAAAAAIHPHRHQLLTREAIIGAACFATTTGLAVLALIRSSHSLAHLASSSGFTLNPLTMLGNLVRVLLMLTLSGAGDQNAQHNLMSQPTLNIFLALMLVTGVLASISRLIRRRYRWLLGLMLLLLTPAIVTTAGVPNAGRSLAAAPIVLALCAIGISYLLELWYATFPINSAARAIGQSAIIVLLGLTVLLGYTQYFKAWGQSSEVYAASNEGAYRLAANLRTSKFTGQIYVVTLPSEHDIVAYIDHKGKAYQAVSTEQLVVIPTTPGPRLFLMTPSQRDTSMKTIKTKFPGGVLRPHYSPFNQVEIYYSYETSK